MNKQDLFLHELSDEILAVRIAQRDTAALKFVYDRFASQVFTQAAMLSVCEDAEHIVLQVFFRLWLEIDQLISQGGSFQEWLLNLTRTEILIRLKRHGEQTAQYIVDAINRYLSDAASQTMKAKDDLHKPSPGQPVWQAFQELTNEQRCVIVLARYGGFRQQEIAQLLGWPVSAVKLHIKQGLQRLRATLKPELVLVR